MDNRAMNLVFLKSCLGWAGLLACLSTAVPTLAAELPANVFHYDFDRGVDMNADVSEATSALSVDSTYRMYQGSNMGETTHDVARSGKAVLLNATYRPRLPNQTAGKHICRDGQATVTAVIKPVSTNKGIVWVMGAKDRNPTIALVVDDGQTLSLAMLKDGVVSVVAAVTGVEGLTTDEHFVVATFNETGISLRVDDLPVVVSDAVTATELGETDPYFSFGRINWGNSMGDYAAQDDQGCWLNDWRAYDVELTADQQNMIYYAFFRSAIPIS